MTQAQFWTVLVMAALWCGITAGSLANIQREIKAMSETDAIPLDSPEVEAMRRVDEATLYVNGPYFTWDMQTIPPTREYHPDHDGQYPVIQVHNSLSPGLRKQGRLIRPVTKPDAELAIWEVDIDGRTVVVHDPEEAWMGGAEQ